MNLLPIAQPIAVFYVFTVLGNQLTYSTTFTTLSLFYLLQAPLTQVPGLIQSWGYLNTSADRILTVLNYGEVQDYIKRDSTANDDVIIRVEKANFGWVLEVSNDIDADVTNDIDGNDKTPISKSSNDGDYEMISKDPVIDSSIDLEENKVSIYISIYLYDTNTTIYLSIYLSIPLSIYLY
jgi:hypothetical protein